MGIPCIDRLGLGIEENWRSCDYAPGAFADLAAKSLQDADLPAKISAEEIAEFVLQSAGLPLQNDPMAAFGQPPITLFRTLRFFIDALFWIDGTTTVHQHRFSGAFQVLTGSSIETLFSFEAERTFDGHFALGSLQASSSGLLYRGDIRTIWGGPRLIHSIFHLDRPSVSIVIRTPADPGISPQFNYARAGIGRNPFFVDEAVERKLQIVSMMRAVQHPDLERLVGDTIARSDLHMAYRVVRECANLGIVDRLIDRIADRDAADRFRVAIRDHRREMFLISRRNVVVEAEARFFLGVLLNAPRRRDVLAITRQKKPDVEPARQVAAWLRQLSTITAKLQVEGAPWQPNLLGLPEFDDEIERDCAVVIGGGAMSDFDARVVGVMNQLRALPALSCLFKE